MHRHREMRVMDGASGSYRHRGVVKRSAEHDPYPGRAEQPHQGVIRRHLGVVAVGDRLRQTI